MWGNFMKKWLNLSQRRKHEKNKDVIKKNIINANDFYHGFNYGN